SFAHALLYLNHLNMRQGRDTDIHLRLIVYKSDISAYRTFQMQHTPSLKTLSRQKDLVNSSHKYHTVLVAVYRGKFFTWCRSILCITQRYRKIRKPRKIAPER